jgi:heptosyltransferase I
MIKSICLVRLSALGDVMMFVPLVRALQLALPQATVTWVISRPAFDLVEGMDGVEFIVIEKPNRVMDYWRFKQRLRGRVFDVLLAAHASLRANLLYPCIRARRKVGYDSARAKDGHGWFITESITPGRDHTLDGFLKFAAVIGVPTDTIRWDLPVLPENKAWAKQQLSSAGSFVLVVNPAASKPERTWPVDRLIEVIRYVQSTWPITVVLTGGPGAQDKILGDAIEAAVPVMNLIGKTKPAQLLAVIAQANLVLCPDTGPSHMAVAVGTPVIALHAVTSVGISGPYTCRDMAVDAYPEAVRQLLGTTADECPWNTHVHSEKAMLLISVDAVIAKIQRVMLKIC